MTIVHVQRLWLTHGRNSHITTSFRLYLRCEKIQLSVNLELSSVSVASQHTRSLLCSLQKGLGGKSGWCGPGVCFSDEVCENISRHKYLSTYVTVSVYKAVSSLDMCCYIVTISTIDFTQALPKDIFADN